MSSSSSKTSGSSQSKRLPDSFFQRSTIDVARNLIGKIIVRRWGTEESRVKIIEAEAYLHGDPAAHCVDKKTPRNTVMFGQVNRVYVYRSYGVHTCFNIVAHT